MTLAQHLATGVTNVCRCWAVTRRDGTVLGFTDHDRTLSFDGITFRADTGLTASALQQTTGLSIDNTETVGALSDASISEADIEAGRFDRAEVRAWRVNWQTPAERELLFKGSIGEITRAGGSFRAELRGLAERLNQPRGRIYQAGCNAVLGDAQCGIDTTLAAYSLEGPAIAVTDGQVIDLTDAGSHADGLFRRGALEVLDGAGAGHIGVVKSDQVTGGLRRLTLWQAPRADIQPGDTIRVTAGCDKSAATCRGTFNNMLNFRGFPKIPGEDWLFSYPRRGGGNTGGSLG